VQATLKRVSAKFERLAADEDADEDADEVKEADEDTDETTDKDDAAETPSMERMSSRFAAIKKKIAGAPELRKDAHVQATLKRVSAKFERLAAAAVDGGDDESPDQPADLERSVEHSGEIADYDARLQVVKRHIMQSPALKGDVKVMAGLHKVMASLERAKASEDKDDTAGVDDSDSEEGDVEAETEGSADSDDTDDTEDTEDTDEEEVAAVKKPAGVRAGAKKESPSGARAGARAGAKKVLLPETDDADNDDANAAGLERVAARFDAIKRMIKLKPALRKDTKLQATLKRIDAKFERLEDEA